MKRLKLILSSVAIVIAVTGAFALREQQQQQPCTNLPQYYFDGSRYQPAGQLGVDYLCQAASNNDTCTFIRQNDTFIPCNYGARVSVDQ